MSAFAFAALCATFCTILLAFSPSVGAASIPDHAPRVEATSSDVDARHVDTSDAGGSDAGGSDAVGASSVGTPIRTRHGDSIDTFYEMLTTTALHMGGADARMDPLALRRRVISFDDGFVAGNVTFERQRLHHLATFTTSSVMIDWQTDFLWLRLRVPDMDVSSVVHIDGVFDNDGDRLIRRRDEGEEEEEMRRRMRRGRRREKRRRSILWYRPNGLGNGIEIPGYAKMKYESVEIDINAQMDYGPQGFLQISKMWSTISYWSRDCSISSYFPMEWIEHLVCSADMDLFHEHEAEIVARFNDFLIKDINEQMRERKIKGPMMMMVTRSEEANPGKVDR